MRSLRFVAALAISAQALIAQQPAGRTSLSLDEAISIARLNNPNFLTTQNNVRVATSGIRQAYSALLPSVSSSFSTSYQQAGTQFVQGVALGASGDTYQSSYRLGVNYFITGAVAFAPRQARANREAAEADVVSSAEATRALVTNQYIASLKAQAQASLADSLVATATGQLDLANAKMKVGCRHDRRHSHGRSRGRSGAGEPAHGAQPGGDRQAPPVPVHGRSRRHVDAS